MSRLILIGMALTLAGCGSEPQVKGIDDMKDDLISNYQVNDVSINDDKHLMITMTLPEDDNLERAANVGFSRMSDMLNYVLVSYPTLDADAKQIYVTFNANLLDSYNNPSTAPVYDTFYDVPELKKLKVNSSSTFYDYLRHANISVRQPVGHDIIEAWCKSDNNTQEFENICS